MQNAHITMQVNGYDPQKFKRQTTHQHTLRKPTPLKNKRRRNKIPNIAQKDMMVQFHPHALKHRRAPRCTIAWRPHTRGPRFRRGTIGRGTNLHHIRTNNRNPNNTIGYKEIREQPENTFKSMKSTWSAKLPPNFSLTLHDPTMQYDVMQQCGCHAINMEPY